MLTRFFTRSFSSIKIQLPEFKTFNLEKSVLPTETTTTKEELLNYLKDMIYIRRIEISSDGFYKNRDIRGFCHLCDGQEAVYVGMESGLTRDDCIISAYRVHGQAYVRGETPRAIFAEMFGRITGSSKGKGGSMHYYNKETNFYGGNGIVGAQVPVGVGLAFALKYKEQPNCSVTLFGDGAANQGQLFEAANMAKLWNLPALLVCENNLYGMGTSIQRSSANPEFYTRGDKIPGILMDGLNVFAVREGMRAAKEWSLKNGPLFIEISTYRYHGHSMSDPGISYRSRDEINDYRQKKDCIERVKNILIENGMSTESELKKLEKEIKQDVDSQAQLALQDPFPEPKELVSDIFAPNTPIVLRNVEFNDNLHLP